MKKQTPLFLLAFILLISFITAQSYTFTHNENVNFRFRCFDMNNSYCSNLTQLIISIEYPNGSNALDNRSMTHNPTYFNVTLPTDTIGTGYKAVIVSPTTNGTLTEFTYDITYQGRILTTSKAVLYLILLLLIVSTIIFTLYGAMKIRWGYKKDNDGIIISFNQLRWLKPALFFLCYLELFFISGLLLGLSRNYLELDLLSNFFEVMFFIFQALLIPIVPITVMLMIIAFFQNKKIKNLIQRGIPYR